MLKTEWDAVAGVLAAVIAIVLHRLDVIETEVLSVIAALQRERRPVRRVSWRLTRELSTAGHPLPIVIVGDGSTLSWRLTRESSVDYEIDLLRLPLASDTSWHRRGRVP